MPDLPTGGKNAEIDWTAFGERVRLARVSKGLALRDLAATANVSPMSLNALENAHADAKDRLSLRDLTVIAKALDTSVASLADLPVARSVEPMTVFFCGRQQRHDCSSCGTSGATTQCSYPVKRAGQPATCGRWLCSRCATPVSDGTICPPHQRFSKEVHGG